MVTGSLAAMASATAANTAWAGLAPARQLSVRSGQSIQHPACRSNSAGIRKPSRWGVDASVRNAVLRPRMLALPRIKGEQECPTPSRSACRSPQGAKKSPSPAASSRCPINPSSPSSKATARARDIWRASVRVFDAAVQKAYGGRRKIHWMEVFAGEKANTHYNTWLPDETVAACREYLVSIKGPLTTPGRRRHPLAQRGAAPAAGSVRLPAPGALVQGRALAGDRAREGRHGDFPREHRGHLRGHRVRGGIGGRARSSSTCSSRPSRSSSRRSASPSPPASASSRPPRRGPSACSARRCSTPSSTSARA